MTITEEQEFTLFRLRHDRFRRTRAVIVFLVECFDVAFVAKDLDRGQAGNASGKYRCSTEGCQRMFEIYKELRKHLAVGPPLLLECAENESALVWFGILAMSLALGYVIYKAIMMRKKEQRDRKLLKEYIGKFPDEPAPPGHTAPLKGDVLHAMFKRS
ncbi:hypothetical protein T4B_2263 [Trichinella pseudospiralis]|uniref:Uncharacterized protein n=1 Tax=Trichinella pseudospiralis TaxID=6337 RepID=A0A0V1H169_TRIPS|nr:hypothetical protein T4B_5659 [Trichinella pseudospiralis]KRZ04322.1 hypothetical protein T4B_8150 [Trichinella pseudospiralis]KRZ04505.1 hypothetical protein T4B_1440 [Trichinella pseudospiralis]KRZ30255.1 hypothetical protein T4B_2263 [Trichinella pseudospiralis]